MMQAVLTLSLSTTQAVQLCGYCAAYRAHAWRERVPTAERNQTMKAAQAVQGKLIAWSAERRMEPLLLSVMGEERAGYAELALQVQDLWLNHQREAATALIPDDLVLKTNLLGTKERVRERLRIYRDGGVKTIDVAPDGQTIEERLAVLGQLIELVNEINAETAGPGSPESDVS